MASGLNGTMEHGYIHGTDPSEQERLAALNALTNEPFLRFLEVKATDAVLEVGSGLGILAQAAAERVPLGEVFGIERSDAQLSRAPTVPANLRFLQGDAHHLPFDDNRFDAVYCRYLLEHVSDPLQVLLEMHRVVKPGGRVLAQENNILVNVLEPPCPKFEYLWQQFVHLQERLGGDALIGRKLFGLYHRAGFRRVELSIQPEIHCAGLASFRSWVVNLIGNVSGAANALQEHELADRQQIDDAVAELRALLDHSDGCAFFYWNRACGWK